MGLDVWWVAFRLKQSTERTLATCLLVLGTAEYASVRRLRDDLVRALFPVEEISS